MSKTQTKSKNYTFDSENKEYVFYTENLVGKNYVLKSEKVDKILKLYSDFDNQPFTSGEIAQKTSTPKKIVEYILKSLGITHSSIPFSDEKIKNDDEESLVQELILEKRTNVEQKLEKLDWRKTVEDAENWNLFQHNYGEYFDKLLSKWNPPKYERVPSTVRQKGNKELIVGCSDWHFGLVAKERYLYNQKEWNIDMTKKAVENYSLQLLNHLIEKEFSYSRVTLAFGGDAIHGLGGFTDKGTKLEAYPLNEEQLEQAFDCTLKFIQTVLTACDNVRVVAVPGNHSSFGDYFLMKMLSIYFKDDERISFEITSKRFITFDVQNSLFLLDHGYAPTTKNRLPAHGTSRENYINNLFLSKLEKLKTYKFLYYLSCDQHHMEASELTNVEHYMFSTLVGGCRHADNSGYKSRPRQSALVVDEQGVKEFIHFYFD